jgi:protein-L-isoaspartate(D-aspartate) O-methyltransferase
MDFERQRRALAEALASEGLLKSEAVRRAFLKVPRELFVWPGMENEAYADMPLPLGDTGQTISAPHMVVIMLDALMSKPGDKVLEVGSGSGYNAALLAELVAPDGKGEGRVITLERIPDLARFAADNIAKAGYSSVVKVVQCDGTMGYPKGEVDVYDRIIVTAAAPRVPLALKKQLKVNGTMLVPLGSMGYQDLMRIRRITSSRFTEENLGGCVFVPLVGEDGY